MFRKKTEKYITMQCQDFGGLAVIAGFLISTIYLLIVMSMEGTIPLTVLDNYYVKLIGFFVGIIVLAFFCFIDDWKGIPPYVKLIGQVISALIVVFSGIRIDKISIPGLNAIVPNEIFSIIVTLIWIVGITNAINLIDGLDGLSSGIALISCVSLVIIFALNGSPIVSILMITSLIGALVGFLPFNFAPAKTFIGDTGSNFLGFILSVISILGVAKTYTAVVIALPILVLGLPILDVGMAIIRRMIKGKSIKAIFKADKGHLHHKLVQKGFSQKQAVLILYGISAAFGMFAVILFDSGILKALSFLLMVIAAVAIGYKNLFRTRFDENLKYECIVCKYIYNPKVGNERVGIKPGTAFEELPENWVCPVCGEKKEKFEINHE